MIQGVLLAAYRRLGGEKWLHSSVGARIFLFAYDIYKGFFEAPRTHSLRQFVTAGAWVIDVGANVGFHTRHFAKWVSDGGRVIAIEPDDLNADLLRRTIRRRIDKVDVIEAAAADFSGPAGLNRSASSHADHRLVEAGEGTAIEAFRLDELMASYGDPKVGLIKIDVQGSEHKVIAGARALINRCQPVLVVEIDLSTPAAENNSTLVLDLLEQLGYRSFGVVGRRQRDALTQAQILERARKQDYIDLVFEPRPELGEGSAC